MGRSGGGGHRSGGHGGGFSGSGHRSSFSHSSSFSGSSGSFHSGSHSSYSGGSYGSHHYNYDYDSGLFVNFLADIIFRIGNSDWGKKHAVKKDETSQPASKWSTPEKKPKRSFKKAIIAGAFALLSGIIGLAAVDYKQKNVTDDKQYQKYATEKYEEIFDERKDCMLILIADEGNTEYQTVIAGPAAYEIQQIFESHYYTYYDSHYCDDLGIQIKESLSNMTTFLHNENTNFGGSYVIEPSKPFSNNCLKDEIGWVDTPFNVATACEEFYEETGIQIYYVVVDEATVAQATEHTSSVVKVLFITAGSVASLYLLYYWWKKRTEQKNKEQEDLERTLSMPLETYQEAEVRELAKKYDDTTTSSESSKDTTKEKARM